MARQTRPVVQPKDVAVTLHLTDQRYRTLRTLIRWGSFALAVFIFMRGLTPLSGKETVVTLAVSLLADMKFAISITLAGAAVAWAVVERTLRHRKTEYLQNRIKKLEQQIDPNRSSSGLTPKGKTNPNDRRA